MVEIMTESEECWGDGGQGGHLHDAEQQVQSNVLGE